MIKLTNLYLIIMIILFVMAGGCTTSTATEHIAQNNTTEHKNQEQSHVGLVLTPNGPKIGIIMSPEGDPGYGIPFGGGSGGVGI